MVATQPCKISALAECSVMKLPPSTLRRLFTNRSIGTDFLDEEDTNPTAAEKKKKFKKSRLDCVEYHDNDKPAENKKLVGHLAPITATKKPTNTEPKPPPEFGLPPDITHAVDYTDLSKVNKDIKTFSKDTRGGGACS